MPLDLPHPARPGAPVRITAFNGPWPLHGAAASRRVERRALDAAVPGALMARAGLAVARLALALGAPLARVQVWAGPGNNGGDALVAARALHQCGIEVDARLVGDPSRLPPDAAQALRDAQAAGLRFSQSLQPGSHAAAPTLVLDGLLGLGASRAPEGALADAIACVNTAAAGGARVLAIDLPSGLSADHGCVLGAAAVRAHASLSLLTLKPGLFTHEGRDLAGECWLDTLGVDADMPDAWLGGPAPRHPRRHASHKGRHGDVLVVGGADGMAGAAWLAARAALASGAGRVYLDTLDTRAAVLDAARPELMLRSDTCGTRPGLVDLCTVVAGCGGGSSIRATLPAVLARAPRLVLDADALNAVADDPALRRALAMRAARGRATLLTPHPLEAARMLGLDTAAVQSDRLAAASRLAADCGAAVLLKGSGSVVVAPGAAPCINPTGNASLATAGSGDVLAGWAAGSWAQQTEATGAQVAAWAAWEHGRAADSWQPAERGGPLPASDLIGRMLLRG